jgi:hypothetical protein
VQFLRSMEPPHQIPCSAMWRPVPEGLLIEAPCVLRDELGSYGSVGALDTESQPYGNCAAAADPGAQET